MIARRIATLAALAALVIATPVWAGPVDMGSLSPPTDSFSITASGLFDGQWAIKLGTDGWNSAASITNVRFGEFNLITGLDAWMDGVPLVNSVTAIPYGTVSTLIWSGVLNSGTHNLRIAGDFGIQASLGGNFIATQSSVSSVPEPPTLALWLSAAIGLPFMARRRRRVGVRRGV